LWSRPGPGGPERGSTRITRVPWRAEWQLPERWTFVSWVPKTSVGKFDKRTLRRQYAAGELTVVEAR
jgi:acyl-coenzyme A synthetase/AMP-(fatty) acid ligase